MPDLGAQLRWYYDSVVVLADPADVIAGRRRAPSGLEPEAAARWWHRPVVVVTVAAVVTLLLIGGITLLSILPSEGPVVTTTAPAPTTTAEPSPTTTTSSVTTSTSVGTTTSTAATTPGMPARLGTTWQRVPDQAALENGWIAAVTEGGPGLVAVGGTGRPLDASAWVSSDGATWERISSGAFRGTEERDGTDGDQQILDVVATSSGLVAVGADEHVVQDLTHATVWVSPDGRTWERLSPLPDDESVSPTSSVLLGVVVGGPGLVAWGEDGNGPGIWASTDGRAWILSTDPDLAPTEEEIALAAQEDLCTSLSLMDVAAGNGLLVAVGYSTVGTCEGMPGDTLRLSPVAWVSEDGLAWDRIPENAITLPAPMPYGDWGFVMRAVTSTDSGFVAIGLGVWASEDGRRWQALDAALYGSTFSSGWAIGESAFVAHLDGRLVAALPPGDVLWASDDGGVGWHPSAEFDGGYLEVLEPSTPEAHATLTEVISTGRRLVAVGSAVQYLGTEDPGSAWPCNRADGWCRSDAAIWIGRWNGD